MRIQTVARRCQVPDPVRIRAVEQVERLGRFDPTVHAAEIIFEEEKHRKNVEAILTRKGEPPVVARGENNDFRLAVDQMLDRLGRILRRSRSQSIDHRAPRTSELVAADPPPVETRTE